MASVEDAHEVYSYGTRPFSGIVVPCPPYGADISGVVDQYVNAAIVGQGPGDGLLDLVIIGHVGGGGEGFGAVLIPDETGGFLQLGCWCGRPGPGGPFRGIGPGYGPPDAAAASRNEGNAFFQPPRFSHR